MGGGGSAGERGMIAVEREDFSIPYGQRGPACVRAWILICEWFIYHAVISYLPVSSRQPLPSSSWSELTGLCGALKGIRPRAYQCAFYVLFLFSSNAQERSTFLEIYDFRSNLSSWILFVVDFDVSTTPLDISPYLLTKRYSFHISLFDLSKRRTRTELIFPPWSRQRSFFFTFHVKGLSRRFRRNAFRKGGNAIFPFPPPLPTMGFLSLLRFQSIRLAPRRARFGRSFLRINRRMIFNDYRQYYGSEYPNGNAFRFVKFAADIGLPIERISVERRQTILTNTV